jgi:hypothetical protein
MEKRKSFQRPISDWNIAYRNMSHNNKNNAIGYWASQEQYSMQDLDFNGDYFKIKNAKLYTPPSRKYRCTWQQLESKQ